MNKNQKAVAAIWNLEPTYEALLAELKSRGLTSSPCSKCSGVGRIEYYAYYASGLCFQCMGAKRIFTKLNDTFYRELRESIDTDYAAKRQATRDKKAAAAKAIWDAGQADRDAIEAEKKAEQDLRDAAQAVRDAELAAKKAVSQFVGKAKDRIELELTCVFTTSFEVRSFSGFGTEWKYLYKMVDAAGNCFTCFTTGSFSIERGETALVKFTVKEHDTYRDEKQTIIQRPKKLETIVEAAA